MSHTDWLDKINDIQPPHVGGGLYIIDKIKGEFGNDIDSMFSTINVEVITVILFSTSFIRTTRAIFKHFKAATQTRMYNRTQAGT